MNTTMINETIKVRLYNKAKAKDMPISRSAAEYGFEDLILCPVVELGEIAGSILSSKMTAGALQMLGITEDEAFTQGIENLDYKITSMREMMIDMMYRNGIPEEMIEEMAPPEEGMWIVSSKNGVCGAASIIKAKEELEKMFPGGYVVLPSSIHEVIVMPKGEGQTKEELLNIVTQINGGVVSEEDRLADNVYEFKA